MLDVTTIDKKTQTTQEVQESIENISVLSKDYISKLKAYIEQTYYTETLINGFATECIKAIADYIEDLLIRLDKNFDEVTLNELKVLVEHDITLCFIFQISRKKKWETEQYYKILAEHLIKKDIPAAEGFKYDFHLFEEETEIENAAQYQTVTSDTMYFFKDKITHNLPNLISGTTTEFAMESSKDKKKGKEVRTYVSMNIGNIVEDLEGSSASTVLKSLTKEEVKILNGVLTEWENGNNTTTIRNILRSAEKNPSYRPSAEEEEKALETLKKFNNSTITIDATAEGTYYNEFKLTGKMYGSLLSIAIDTAQINGTRIYDAVHILDFDKSPVYRYAKVKKQIASVSSKQLGRGVNSDVEIRVNRTKGTGKIEDYLIERIEAIPNISNTILISSIFEAAEIYEKDYKNFKDKKNKTIKKIHTILDNWITTGYIKGYTDNKKGNRLHSITIKK